MHKYNQKDDRSDIIKKGISFLFFRGSGILGGYLFTYIIANKFGASTNGLVVLCFSIFIFASLLGRLGIDVNLVKFYSNHESWNDNPGLFYRVLLKSFLFSILLAICLFFLEDQIVFSVFKKPQLEAYYIWAIAAIPFWVIIMHCAGALRAKGLNNWFAFLNNSGRFVFSTLFLLLLGLFSFDYLNPIKAHFFAIVLLAIISLFVVIKTFKKISISSAVNSWAFLKESFPMMLSSTIIILLGWMDTFILGLYETDEAIGVYNVALKIAAISSFSLEAINSSLAPKISNLYRLDKRNEFKNLIRFSTNMSFMITVVVVIGTLIFHEFLLGIFGEEFLIASTALIILCSVYLVNSGAGSVGIIMQMTGYQKQYRNIAIIALIINLSFNFYLIPLYGINGAAAATGISICFWNISGAVFLKRKENLITYFNPIKSKS